MMTAAEVDAGIYYSDCRWEMGNFVTMKETPNFVTMTVDEEDEILFPDECRWSRHKTSA